MLQKNQWLDFSNLEFSEIPFRHFLGREVLKNDYCKTVFEWLDNTDMWKLTKTDFYTQYEFSLVDVNLPSVLEWLTSKETVYFIGDFFKTQFDLTKVDLTGITAHQLIDGQRIGIHNDFLEHEETHRFIFQFNPLWHDDYGGFLMLFNSGIATDVAKLVRPINNSVFGFEISEKSFHAVSTVKNYKRYTLVYTYKAS